MVELGLPPLRNWQATGYDKLPTSDPIELAKWFREACDSGSLEKILRSFCPHGWRDANGNRH